MRSQVVNSVPFCTRRKELDFNLQDFQTAEKKRVLFDDLSCHIIAGSRVCISGGHYSIDPRDPRSPGNNPRKTFQLAVSLVNRFINEGKQAKISLIMNDSKLHAENYHNFWQYFVFPPAYVRLIIHGGLTFNDTVITAACRNNPWFERVHSERALANRFSSKSKTKGFGNRYPAIAERYMRKIEKDPDAAMGCFKGTTEFIEDLADLGFDTIVTIFPTCSHTNVEYALAAGKEAHPEVSLYGFFYTDNCY